MPNCQFWPRTQKEEEEGCHFHDIYMCI
jgi:hypothetical protein